MKKNLANRYLIRHKGQIVLYALCAILSVLFTLFSIFSLSDFLHLLFQPNDAQEITKMNLTLMQQASDNIYGWILRFDKKLALLIFSALLFASFFLKNLFLYFSARISVSLRNKVLRDMRNDLYKKLLRLPLSFYGSNRKGDIISRFSTDVYEFDEFILKAYQTLFIAIASLILYLFSLFYLNYKLSLFVLIILPFAGILISRISRKLRHSIKIQEQMSVLMSLIEETIGGIRIIKSFTAIKFSNDRFQQNNKEVTQLRNRLYRTVDLASPISDFLGNTIVICILLFGSSLILAKDSGLTVENFLVYIILFAMVINPAKDLSTGFYNLRRGKSLNERINEILDTHEEITEKVNAFNTHHLEKEITFKNVSFSYNNASDLILENLNLHIEKGKFVALVGHSGAGKSTIVDLLARFYDCTSGEVCIDGINVKDMKLKPLRSLIGFVTQDTLLFNDSIFNNIALGKPDATEEEVIEAAKVANAHDFIMQMEDGYQTMIGDRGGKLSGGQRQRISIARAVLCKPDILIFDEATSALDTESEHLVQEALSKIMKNHTSIVIAHRLSTIQHADEIIVLENGKIVEHGTHKELVNAGGIYQSLYEMQNFEK